MNNAWFQPFEIPKREKKLTVIQFVNEKKLEYWKGCAFYELIEPKLVRETRSIAVEEIHSRKLIVGDGARTLLKLHFENCGEEKIEINPNEFKEYRIYLCTKLKNKEITSTFLYQFKKGYDVFEMIKTINSSTEKKPTLQKEIVMESKQDEPINKLSSIFLFFSQENVPLNREIPFNNDVNYEFKQPEAKKFKKISTSNLNLNQIFLPPQEIQIAILFDLTGSMGTSIEMLKQSLIQTISSLLNEIPNLQIAVIEENLSLLKIKNFTRKSEELSNIITTIGNTTHQGFNKVYEYSKNKFRSTLNWNQNAKKCLIFLSDRDEELLNNTFNKSKLDWKNEANALYRKGIKVYSIKCLHSKPTDFFKKVAYNSGGVYLEMQQFSLICEFIRAITLREADLKQLSLFKKELLVKNEGNLHINLQQLFAKLTAKPKDQLSSNDFKAVKPGRFQILQINDSDESIRNFINRHETKFKPGKGFYEYTRREEIQYYKEIILMDKINKKMFNGAKAREYGNIADHVKKRKIAPKQSDRWIRFIQSTSHNRKLIKGTRFLIDTTV